MMVSVLLLALTLYLLGLFPRGFSQRGHGVDLYFTEAAQGISFDAMVRQQKALSAIVAKTLT